MLVISSQPIWKRALWVYVRLKAMNLTSNTSPPDVFPLLSFCPCGVLPELGIPVKRVWFLQITIMVINVTRNSTK